MHNRKTHFFLLLITIWMSFGFLPGPGAQRDQAIEIFESMTTAEKVGQLFLVTFKGDSIEPGDPIYQLISEYDISGVLLSRQNNNFNPAPDTAFNLKTLISKLQQIQYDPALLLQEGETSSEQLNQSYLPLFIGMDYEGGQHGSLNILNGLSPMASNLALGAAWDAELASVAGETLGGELEAIGVNLLLGPALDVLEDPQTSGSSDLGVRAFGGDPYWVSVIGQAFISGIHTGSDNRIAVVASHFPGLGGSDRSIDVEVATVRKTLEELKQFDLAPFFSVTEPTESYPNGMVQGLLTSHIRYQGFQGNIRATTRPISLDPQAFELVMSLEPLSTWRKAGGVTISDTLGSRAIRLFRDPTGQTFNAHLVARDAFLAGNDLLRLENFRDSKDPDEFSTIVATLEFFENKYTEDPIFAQRVDDAVLRIIRLKLSIFNGSVTFPDILEPVNSIELVGDDFQLASQVAQSAASLISPEQNQINSLVDGIPRIGERIVFLTDVRYVRQCSNCPIESLMSVDALERAVLRLFGPGAAGQVGGWNLLSYTFADLANYLGERTSETLYIPLAAEDEVDQAVRNADWLVFNVMDSQASTFGADALQVFLDRRPDLARQKKVIVFTYDIPYGFDATEISKIDVFYAMFDSGQAFVDMAAKLLFQEQRASGASPVSIPGIGYKLIEITAPDPNQVIQLSILYEPEGDATVEPEGVRIGDSITIQTGIITDHNGHPVPDRTPVDFLVSSNADGAAPQTIESSTFEGRAVTTIAIDQPGLLTITASAGSARISETLQIDAQEDEFAQAIVISPTLMPTMTREPTTTPPIPTSTPEHQDDNGGAIEGSFSSRLGALVLGLLALSIVSGIGYFTARKQDPTQEVMLKYLLLPALTGLLAYNYLALGLPGSLGFTTVLGGLGVFAVVTMGSGAGLLIAYLWQRFTLPHERGE